MSANICNAKETSIHVTRGRTGAHFTESLTQCIPGRARTINKMPWRRRPESGALCLSFLIRERNGGCLWAFALLFFWLIPRSLFMLVNTPEMSKDAERASSTRAAKTRRSLGVEKFSPVFVLCAWKVLSTLCRAACQLSSSFAFFDYVHRPAFSSWEIYS